MRAAALLVALCLAGCNENAIIRAFPVIEVQSDQLEFGEVAVGWTADRELIIRNTGVNTLNLGPPSVWENSDAAFWVSEYDRSIEPDRQGKMVVTFRPVEVKRHQSVLVVFSDDPDNQSVQVGLGGDGFRQGAIEVEPLQIDFGTVDAGSVSLGTVFVRNVGNGDLYVNGVDLTEATRSRWPDYGIVNPLTSPQPLAQGAEAQIRLTYRPGPQSTSPGIGYLLVQAADPFQPETLVRLTASLNRAPLADAGPDQEVSPLTTVTLDGSASFDPDGHHPLAYAWTLTRRPEGSEAALAGADTERPTFFTELVGIYEAELYVSDSTGLRSLLPDRVTVNAIPAERLLAELVWDSPVADLDLHMVFPGGSPGGLLDCYYGNPNPDWGTPGDPSDDPVFLRDDLMGFGPETVAYEQPLDATYTFLVNYFAAHTPSGREPTTASLRIFIDGQLKAEISGRLEHQGQWWTVATVRWPEGEVSKVDLLE